MGDVNKPPPPEASSAEASSGMEAKGSTGPPPGIFLDPIAFNEFNTREATALLDAIDNLRELHIHDKIAEAPQIVVVGDQSAGKSSVLEAISRIHFPIKAGLCTRFPVVLKLRRAPETKVSYTMIRDESGAQQSVVKKSFHKDDLPVIVKGLGDAMAKLPGNTQDGVSADIVQVEVFGPKIYNLTLVDLPGFFPESMNNTKSKVGKAIVEKLTERYMQDPKSIILAVVPANQSSGQQTVIHAAKKHDPNEERTLAVFTKPDLALADSANTKVTQQMIEKKENRYVLRNRPEGDEEMSDDERDDEEAKFFRTSEWRHLPPSKCGIVSLRTRLSKALLMHMNVRDLMKETERALSDRQRRLGRLGKPRLQPDDLRVYLMEIADRFQRLSQKAIEGRYDDDYFGDFGDFGTPTRPRKFRAQLRNLTTAFHATLVHYGVDREIKNGPIDDRVRAAFTDNGFEWVWNGNGPPKYLAAHLSHFDDIPTPETIFERDLYNELEDIAAFNLGTGYPGLVNASLGFQVFKKQAKPWGPIAEVYLTGAVDLAECLVLDMLDYLVGPDQQSTNAITTTLVADFFEAKRELLKSKLDEILQPYSTTARHPPLGAAFQAALLSRMARRETARLVQLLLAPIPVEQDGTTFTNQEGKKSANTEGNKGGRTSEQVDGATAVQAERQKNMQEAEKLLADAEKLKASAFESQKVIDVAMTHFQMSLGTFAENVVNMAVEACLVQDLPKILTPAMVGRMDEGRLKELASEAKGTAAERDRLQSEVKTLREALKACRVWLLHERV